MEPDRRIRISELYHRALERAPVERSAFLKDASEGDEALRREVESLLACESASTRFLETPAVEVAGALGGAHDPTPMIGRQLGPYRILTALGAGGMGEVYRARDTTLGRDVAIKILPTLFTADPERRARFAREARVLATLNHPHIGAIYGLEETDGATALILELVEGLTLANRLERGPLALADALAIARQVAEALDAAHEKGIVHRDLKPANIVLQRSAWSVSASGDPRAKVLDFGLAKMIPVGADATEALSTSFDGTVEGRILGTPPYMSPEQARGETVDKRADIWAFGCVLFEMLSGRRPFDGKTVTDTLACILEREPDWSALPRDIPPNIRTLLRRCLQKSPQKRLHDIADARMELDDADMTSADDRVAASASRRPRVWLPWFVAAAFAVVACAVAVLSITGRGVPAAAGGLTYVDIPYPTGVEPLGWLAGRMAISPDGRTVAMIGVRGGIRTAFIRRLDHPDAYEVPDSAGVNWLAFSPEGANVAFMTGNGTVVTLSLRDQQRKAITSGADIVGSAAWGAAGVIFNRDRALWIVPPGGEPRALTQLDEARGEVLHTDPSVLPDGRTVLFSSMTKDPGAARIEAVSVENGTRSVILDRATTPAWSPSGHLLFARDEAVMAAPADAVSGAVRGAAVTVIPAGVVATQGSGALGYRLGAGGALLYVPYDAFTRRVVSVNHDGAVLEMELPPGRYSSPRVSPDGGQLLLEDGRTVIQTLDLSRGTSVKLAPAALGTSFATWTTDGQKIVLRRFNQATSLATDGSAREETPSGVITNDYPSASGPDADSILVVRVQPDTAGDVYLLSLSAKYPPRPLVRTKAFEGGPQLSPDRRWLLYQSDTSDASEIYVRRYPELDRSWPVSAGGGVQPRWNGNGEICYRAGSHLMAVEFSGERAEPVLGKPRALFADNYDFGEGLSIANYDITHDGRFIMLRRIADSGNLRVVVNWKDELVRLIRASGVK